MHRTFYLEQFQRCGDEIHFLKVNGEIASFGVFQLVYSELIWHSESQKNGCLHPSFGGGVGGGEGDLANKADMDRQ